MYVNLFEFLFVSILFLLSSNQFDDSSDCNRLMCMAELDAPLANNLAPDGRFIYLEEMKVLHTCYGLLRQAVGDSDAEKYVAAFGSPFSLGDGVEFFLSRKFVTENYNSIRSQELYEFYSCGMQGGQFSLAIPGYQGSLEWVE